MSQIDAFLALAPVGSDIFVAVAAIVGAAVAVVGLRSWRKQLKAQTEYALARRLFRGVLRVRDRLQHVRSPHLPGDFDEMRRAYEERLSAVDSAWRALETDLLEAEVLWGREAKSALQALRNTYAELAARVGEYLWTKNPGPPPWQQLDRSPERLERLEKIVLFGRDEKDAYAMRLENAVKDVEILVRPKLSL